MLCLLMHNTEGMPQTVTAMSHRQQTQELLLGFSTFVSPLDGEHALALPWGPCGGKGRGKGMSMR